MSVQFGRWNFDGQAVEPGYFDRARKMLAPYGPDGEGLNIKDGAGILYRAFHTSKESRIESQPFVTPSGTLVCWDGRLDNREELVREKRNTLKCSSTDLEIVAAAYEEWGTGCFAKLVGDWAVSLWESRNRSLILAKDAIGTRHLYYSFEKDQVTWSTILDPLVLLAGKSFALEEEYIAGWLSFFPATHLTPYVGIHSVPPSCFVRLEPGRQTIHKYWDFDPSSKIRYRTDGEYEGHFRTVFREAVRRRLRSDSPILAELSGGMDSSSIVCMADEILAGGEAETPQLNTVSYYDDSEPNWNERPYFTKVEEKRGRAGCHIEVRSEQKLLLEPDKDLIALTPSSGARPSPQLIACITSQGNRVVLSGIGGDEVMGGVPTPVPELQDLLANGEFKRLAHQLKIWAIDKRRPWFHLLWEAAHGFSCLGFANFSKRKRPAAWLTRNFVKNNQTALHGYEGRVKFFGPLPSFQANAVTLEALRRRLACSSLACEPACESRYPFLDRDLLEFVYAVPREQLVRPGQRRSLMRRALIGVVPEEILNRRRKAYVVRGPMAEIRKDWERLTQATQRMLASDFRIVDSTLFTTALCLARDGKEVGLVPLLRALTLERWLRNLEAYGMLRDYPNRAALHMQPLQRPKQVRSQPRQSLPEGR